MIEGQFYPEARHRRHLALTIETSILDTTQLSNYQRQHVLFISAQNHTCSFLQWQGSSPSIAESSIGQVCEVGEALGERLCARLPRCQ